MIDQNGTIRWFDSLGINDILCYGGKNANLGELKKIASQSGFSVPDGFAISIRAFDDFISHNNLASKIIELLESTHKKNNDLSDKSKKIKSLFQNGLMPEN